MNILQLCEQDAIDFFKQYNIDLTTKEKRVALDKNTKQEVLNFLAQRYAQYQLGFM